MPRAISDEERLLSQCTFFVARSSSRGADLLSGFPASPLTTEWRRQYSSERRLSKRRSESSTGETQPRKMADSGRRSLGVFRTLGDAPSAALRSLALTRWPCRLPSLPAPLSAWCLPSLPRPPPLPPPPPSQSDFLRKSPFPFLTRVSLPLPPFAFPPRSSASLKLTSTLSLLPPLPPLPPVPSSTWLPGPPSRPPFLRRFLESPGLSRALLPGSLLPPTWAPPSPPPPRAATTTPSPDLPRAVLMLRRPASPAAHTRRRILHFTAFTAFTARRRANALPLS